MKLYSRSLVDGGVIPGRCAFAVQAPVAHLRLSQNRNPHLAWTQVPEGTRSFALSCIDSEVPTRGDDVNQEGRIVPADLPRADFVHWLMVDIPASVQQIAEGACSAGVTAKGKREPAGPAGSVQGVNDYTGWFGSDAQMGGQYLGYDGPCPPWNDARVHRYRFEVLALDTAGLGLAPGFARADFERAVSGHVLARASILGRYSLNPAIRLR
ncbi:hypothetical protein SAMN04488038_1167 [Solimonas aquatica]|uniref:Phospholipid-binding protein, PBP family n=1 Tax=Solimonas aquatica TaxID=489703 RepID=A0A1H9LFW6_9GAMM|nr:YbhB/YbcL family Raf kinase inhibitor-like protein [Solimonas aquatica]SER10025.1 hypothetical protein SAMN04488038_1167 [Solimonas aquatica]